MKKYAIYLPQFHEIPENNKWWGDGFTEWTNVKKARALFRGHQQPKVPYNQNYYCLDDKKVLMWQAELAKKYGIDGMVFYQYYFCGKKLLEKPAEILLKNADIPMNFFFCWANHSWCKSWEGSKEILMPQTYGTKEDWEKHFMYLLPFFKDARYEKKDNRPVFMIFKPFFDERKAMFEYFNTRCQESGFSGIHIIETCTSYDPHEIERLSTETCSYTKQIYLREPDAALTEFKKTAKFMQFRVIHKISKTLKTKHSSPVQRIQGNWLYDVMISKKGLYPNSARGAFFEWDNTPRHSERGFVILPVSKEKFFRYMESIKDCEYVFLNAWNEWAEGMMLEPTEENGYRYLEWIKEWGEKL